MKTNKAIDKIMKEAETKAIELYPPGTRIKVRLREDWRIDMCEIDHFWQHLFKVRSLITGKMHNFHPAIHPHEITYKPK